MKRHLATVVLLILCVLRGEISHAAVAYQTASALATGTTSVTASAPSGTANGNVLLAFIVDHATSGSSAAPTGWTNQGGATASAGRFQVFSCVYGKNSCSGSSWQFTGLTLRSGGVILRFTGVDNGTPIDVAVSARQNSSSATGTTSITPTSANAMIVAGFGSMANGATWSAHAVATNPGTMTEATDNAYSSYLSISTAWGLQSGAGAATGASSATMSTTANNAGILVALRPAVVPTVTTQAVNAIATTTATGNGTVTADGGNDVTDRGTCAKTSSGCTTADSHWTGGTGTGAFTTSMTGLNAGTHYYVRAYAINAIGTSYGNEVTFDTLSATACVSQAAGNWSNAATWTSCSGCTGGVPSNGCTATVNYAVTVDVNTTVGTSPAAGNTALSVSSGASLTIASGVTLVVRGDFAVDNAAITIRDDSVLEFDPSASASPSTTAYRFLLGNSYNNSTVFQSANTSAAHPFTVRD